MPDTVHPGQQIIDEARDHVERIRYQRDTYRLHRDALFEALEFSMLSIDTLIKTGQDLMAERNSLKQDRDSEKARADGLQDQLDAIDKQASDAAAALQTEVTAELPVMPVNPTTQVTTASVAAASTAPTSTVVVTGDNAVPIGAGLSGPGIATGTTASDVSTTTAVDGSTVSTISLSQPTTADHVGDQSEVVTVTPTPPAAQ